MRRREFITLLGGAAATWPLAARAQQLKRVGALMLGTATEQTGAVYLGLFVQGMRKLGWIEGQNLQLEVRWSAGEINLMQAYATDLVQLFKPDVLVAASTSNLVALQRATSAIP